MPAPVSSTMSSTTETPTPPKAGPVPSSTNNSTDIVKDVYLWRRWRVMSAAVLLVSTAVWVVMEVYHFNFITLSSWLAMLLVSSSFLWGNIFRLLRKEAPDMSGLQVTEESAIGVANCTRQWGEAGVRWMLRIGAEKEWFVFAGTIAALWLLSIVGNCSDLLTLLYFGNVVGMVVPALYVRYEYKIKEYVERLKMQSKRLYGMVNLNFVQKLRNKAVGSKKDKKVE